MASTHSQRLPHLAALPIYAVLCVAMPLATATKIGSPGARVWMGILVFGVPSLALAISLHAWMRGNDQAISFIVGRYSPGPIHAAICWLMGLGVPAFMALVLLTDSPAQVVIRQAG